MTWAEAKQEAERIMADLCARLDSDSIRLVIRALGRHYQKEKATMQQPQIIVAATGPDKYTISVSGKFGGGFQNLATDRAGVLSRLAHLKSYDCGEEPAAVVCPTELEPEFRKVFPKSFTN